MGKIQIERVVIDTNVMISALLFGGEPGKLITLWKEKRIQPLISQEILDEYVRVLVYPKFELSADDVGYILYGEILPYFDTVVTRRGSMIVAEDPSDYKFIRCAQSGRAGVIISGDQHLLRLKSYRKIRIVTPARFLRDKAET